VPLSIAFAQDLSGSFGDDIANVRALLGDVIDGILEIDPAARLAITSFVDKPILPFGSDSDYAYKTDLSSSTNREDLIQTYNELNIYSGSDWYESQLEALLQIALRDSEVGWSSEDDKVVILFTDAPYHEEGDGGATSEESSYTGGGYFGDGSGGFGGGLDLPKNNYDEILDGTPEGTGEDYPAISEVGFLLRLKGIKPIFAVADNASNLYDTYTNLVKQLGAGGGVVTITTDSSNIVDAVNKALVESGSLEYDLPVSGLSLAEGGTASLDMRLSRAPLADVEVEVTTSDTTQATTSPSKIIFTPDNWNEYQSVSIFGLEDSEPETNQRLSLDFSEITSEDAAFNGFRPQSAFFTLTDNDFETIESGTTFIADPEVAVSLALGAGSTLKPSKLSDTVKFDTTSGSKVTGTGTDLRDDIYYDFTSKSEINVEIEDAALATLNDASEEELKSYYKVTKGSAIIQIDTNLDGDFNDVSDTIFTLKGNYDPEKIRIAKTTGALAVFYDGEITTTDSPSISPTTSGGSGSASSSTGSSTTPKPSNSNSQDPADVNSTNAETVSDPGQSQPTKPESISVLGISPQSGVTRVSLPQVVTIKDLSFEQATVGTTADDLITGGDTSDLLTGAGGRDRITGNGGADAFVFDKSSGFGKYSFDTITDFNPKEGDLIAISQEAFGGLSRIKFKSISGKRQLRREGRTKKDIIYDNRKGMIYYDANGKQSGWGDGGEFAKLLGAPTIGKNDFSLI